MNVEEYLRLANTTRNSELELISLYNEKQRILESRSRCAKLAELELDKIVLALRQEVDDLKMNIRKHEAMYNEAKNRNDVLRRENDELRQMLEGSQRKVLKDYAEVEKERDSLRKENIRLGDRAARLQQEKGEIEKQNKGLSEENTQITQQKTRLLAENSALARENERLKRDVQVRDEKSVQDIENARSELVRRNKELECSNKDLGASLLNMQLQYNDLLVKNAEILKNACTKENVERRAAVERAGQCNGEPESSTGDRQKTVQREDVVAILRELLRQNGDSRADTQTNKANAHILSEKDSERAASDTKQSKSSRKETTAKSKSTNANLSARSAGRTQSKRSAPQPEKDLQKNVQPAEIVDTVLGGSSSSEEKNNNREAASCANKSARGAVTSKSQVRKTKGAVADNRNKAQTVLAPKKRAKVGPLADSAFVQQPNVVKELSALPAKKIGGTMKDTGMSKKEISKIDNESFFANLTFSSSSPFFKK